MTVVACAKCGGVGKTAGDDGLSIRCTDCNATMLATVKMVWAAYALDSNGRKAGRIGLFDTESQASHRAAGKGDWGSNGLVERTMIILDSATREVYVVAGKPTRMTVDVEAEEAAREERAKALIGDMSPDDVKIVLEYLSKNSILKG